MKKQSLSIIASFMLICFLVFVPYLEVEGAALTVKVDIPEVQTQSIGIPVMFGLGEQVVNPEYTILKDSAVKVLENNIIKFGGYDLIVPHTLEFPIPYCWNTYFHTIGALYFNTTLARENINALFTTQNANGMIPNAPTSKADQDLRSQAPLISAAILKYYQVTGDSASLNTWYPKLLAYYNWYLTNGQPEGSIPGLIAPFTARRSPSDGDTAYYIAASTGLNNNPVYDGTGGVYTKIGNYYYFEMGDLILSSTMALFAKNMADISSALNITENYASFINAYNAMANAINTNLWQDSDRLYYAKAWNGTIFQVNTGEAFMPMIAGVPNATQASLLVEHLRDSNEYNLLYGLPTVAANGKYYTKQPSYFKSVDPYHWRGPTWAPMVYLTYLGLKQYGYNAEARDIALKWINMVKGESAYPFAGYYDSRTGKAQSQNSNFAWTAAVTLALIEEECKVSNTSISISTESFSMATGSAVNVFGKLCDSNATPLANKQVVLSYTFLGANSWIPISSTLTDDAGKYVIQWINTASGTFTLKTEWGGDSLYMDASNTTTLSFLPIQRQQVLIIESNSTISALAFNSTSSEVSFNATGPSATTGYVTITVAKTALANGNGVKIYLDGRQLNYSVTSTADSWLITFNYSHSTHQIITYLGTSVSSTQPFGVDYRVLLGIVIALAASVAVVVVAVQKIKKNTLGNSK